MKIFTRLMASKLTYIKVLLTLIVLLSVTTESIGQITGVWSQSGPRGEWQAQAGSVYVRLTYSRNIINLSTETMGCAGAYSDPSVDNNPSLRLTANADGTGAINGDLVFAFFDGPTSTNQISVNAPIMHVDRVGGASGVPGSQLSNSGLYTLTNGTWSELSQNGVHFVSTSTEFQRSTGVVMDDPNTAECTTSPSAGTSAGSLQLNGTYSTISINATQAAGGPNGGDAIELVFTGLVPEPPSIQVAKSAVPTGDVNVGDTISYTVEIENNGSVNANNINVTDLLPSGLNYVSGTASATYWESDLPTNGSFSYTMSPANQTFNSTGLTQTYTVTSADIPSNAILTSYTYNVTVSTTDWLSEISMVASYPQGSLTAGSFGGDVAGNNVSQTATVNVNGAISALGNYNFVWDDPNDFGTNTVNDATFTINYTIPTVNRSQVTNTVNDPANMIISGDNINLFPGETMTVTLNAIVNASAAGTAQTNTVNVGANYIGTVSDTASNNVLIPVDQCDASASGNLDTDGDNVSDICDLDDDNDGILDINELSCSPGFVNLGQTFTNNDTGTNGGSASATLNNLYSFDGVDVVSATYELLGSTTWGTGVNSASVAGVNGDYINTQLNNSNFPNGDVGVYTYTFSEPVYNVEFKFGGLDNQDRADFTASNGAINTPVILSDINLGANGVFSGQSVVSSAGGANAPNNAVRAFISGPVTEISITVGKQDGNSGAVTMQFFELEYCVAKDTDGDGIPDIFDIDSDGDGCFDALEGGDNILISNVLANGQLDGAVNSTTGVPNNVDVNNGQTAGTSTDNTQFDSFGQCDSDGDGVIDTNDICNGFDDSVDIDNDGVPNGCDLDNDNDGILDTDEGKCTSQVLSGAWTISGTTASYDFGNGVIAEVSTTNAIDFTAGNFTNDSFWTENLANDTSLQNQYIWGSTLTVNYVDALGNPVTVTNPIIHLDRLGGTDGVTTQNGAIVTLLNGLTWNELTGTSDFNVASSTASDTGINAPADPAHTQESTQNDADGTAAGTLQINGEISTFTLEFVQGGLFGTGTDGIEIILSTCQSTDTDNDNIPDYLDVDSDGDGCYDAIEGAGSFTIANLTSSNNLADDNEGQVDANGIPEDASANSLQQATTSGVTDNTDLTACGGVTGTVDITDTSVPGDTLDVVVTDNDLNTDPLVAETIVVTVVNDVTGESEDITLTETGP
ncbi:beta strand repeat-containing protein, partial [Olleya marilimosa]